MFTDWMFAQRRWGFPFQTHLHPNHGLEENSRRKAELLLKTWVQNHCSGMHLRSSICTTSLKCGTWWSYNTIDFLIISVLQIQKVRLMTYDFIIYLWYRIHVCKMLDIYLCSWYFMDYIFEMFLPIAEFDLS